MLLSIVLAGRNDGYLTDYIYRLETTINQYSVSLPDDTLDFLEVILVDWGSEVPLCDVISLTPKARKYTKFLEVPPQSAGVGFDQITAINIGIRSSEGEFVMLSDSDCVYTPYSLNQLFAILSKQQIGLCLDLENQIFNISRVQVPESFVQRRPGYEAIQQKINQLANNLNFENQHLQALGGFAGAQLMAKKMWEYMRGFYEGGHLGWGAADNAITLRVCKKGDWHNLAQYGVICYHLNHSSLSKADASSSFLSKPNAPFQTRSHSFLRNNKNWGRATETFKLAKSRAPTLDVDQYLNKGLDNLGVSSSIEKLHPKGNIRPVLRYAGTDFNLNEVVNFFDINNASVKQAKKIEDASLTILNFVYTENPQNCLIDLKGNELIFEVLSNLLPDMDYCVIRAFEGYKEHELETAMSKMSMLLGSYEINGKTSLTIGDTKTANDKIKSQVDKQFDLIVLTDDFFISDPEGTFNTVWKKLSINGLLCISCLSDQLTEDLSLVSQEIEFAMVSNTGAVVNLLNLLTKKSKWVVDFLERSEEPCLLRVDKSGVIHVRKTSKRLLNYSLGAAYK